MIIQRLDEVMSLDFTQKTKLCLFNWRPIGVESIQCQRKVDQEADRWVSSLRQGLKEFTQM